MKRPAVCLAFCLLGASCAAASGYDPKRYGSDASAPADPDTVALAPTARTSIADPNKPAPPAPPAPAPPPTVQEEDAGPKTFWKLMHELEDALKNKEGAKLTSLFEEVATFHPGWASWTAIAKKGAALAKKGDFAGAANQCEACHAQHPSTKKGGRAR